MLVNARAVALLLAISVSGMTTLFLSLFPSVSWLALLVGFGICFSATFLFVYFVLEFLLFKEINKLYASLAHIKQKELQLYTRNPGTPSNPLRKINHEIVTYISRKEQEIERLKKLESYRKEFIADVSHELKTPIFAAQGYVLTLMDGALDDEKVKYKFLKKAAKALKALDILVQDLLTLSRIESREIKMKYEVFDLKELVQDVFDQLEGKAEKKQATMRLAEAYPDGVYVHADPLRIRQVLTNLVHNAIKYGNDDGCVEVALEPRKSFLRVSVSDDGPGIPEEHRQRIFERFYRVDKSRSKAQGGTGLGLSIAKHIIREHNSRIEITDSPLGGVSFRFRLEKANKPAAEAPDEPALRGSPVRN